MMIESPPFSSFILTSEGALAAILGFATAFFVGRHQINELEQKTHKMASKVTTLLWNEEQTRRDINRILDHLRLPRNEELKDDS